MGKAAPTADYGQDGARVDRQIQFSRIPTAVSQHRAGMDILAGQAGEACFRLEARKW